MSSHDGAVSPFRQPKAVWAVALACVVSFMGIGLVDPILPALAKQLDATPSSVELLFTSYLVVTAVAMLITGWVSSRIGTRRTLITGLTLIVVFSALAGSSHTISQIIGFRAGWGLGNALFIATSLAVIVGSASGGFRGAIILYETALGVGIALGPRLEASWAPSAGGAFYGVTVLMGIALAATIAFVQGTPRLSHPTSVLEPIRALRHRGLATMSVTALFYNWGFFTLLAYTPFLMHLGIHQLGYVFTGWGVMVAIFAVFVAPRLQRRFGTPNTLYVSLALLAIDLLVIAIFSSSKTTLIVAVIVSGAFIGLNNTLTTQAVMSVAPVEKPIASASYGFVRFIGGGLAPYCASKLAIAFNVSVPFYVAAGSVVIGICVLATGHALLTNAEKEPVEELVGPSSASPPMPPGRAPSAVTELVPSVGRMAGDRQSPIVAAIDAGPYAERVTDVAIELALLLDCPVEVLHVIETDVMEELALDLESHDAATNLTVRSMNRVRAAGLAGSGHVLQAISDHGEVGRRIAAFANDRHAQMVVIGSPSDAEIARAFDADLTDSLIQEAQCAIHIVQTGFHQRAPSAAQPAAR